MLFEGWRDGSEVKSIDCSSRGPEFKSQQPHGKRQKPELYTLGEMMLKGMALLRHFFFVLRQDTVASWGWHLMKKQ